MSKENIGQEHVEVMKEWNVGMLVFDKRNLVQITTYTTIEEALFVLQRENILALPVYDEERGTFVRILTIYDIMTYVAFGSFKINQEEADAYSVFKSAKIPVSELINEPIHPEDEKVWIFNGDEKIYKVLEPMSKGVHRVLVDLNNGEGTPLYRMLTQTDILRFLSSYILYENGSVDPNEKVANFKYLNQQKIQSVNENVSALDAYRLFQYKDIVAVPLVDNSGKLVATLSASDLRGLRSYQLKSILLPSIQFLMLYRGPAAKRCVTCTENDSLSDVIRKFVVHRVHRLWIVNELLHPVGVLSLSDLISQFVSYQ